ARSIEVLALRDVELGVPSPLARGAFVAQRIAGDVLVRLFLRNSAPRLADHQRDLAFVVELLRYARAYQGFARTDERVGRTEKHARVLRRFAAVFVFLIAVGVVHADTKDFF